MQIIWVGLPLFVGFPLLLLRAATLLTLVFPTQMTVRSFSLSLKDVVEICFVNLLEQDRNVISQINKETDI